MNNKDNRVPHCMWHYSAEFLRQARAMGRRHRVLTPALIQRAASLHRKLGSLPAPLASEVKEAEDEGFFDLTRSVEVVPLGCYTDWDKMVESLREHYRADVVNVIECDGNEVVGVRWYPDEALTEGLHHAVTVAVCREQYIYTMLVVAMRSGK